MQVQDTDNLDSNSIWQVAKLQSHCVHQHDHKPLTSRPGVLTAQPPPVLLKRPSCCWCWCWCCWMGAPGSAQRHLPGRCQLLRVQQLVEFVLKPC